MTANLETFFKFTSEYVLIIDLLTTPLFEAFDLALSAVRFFNYGQQIGSFLTSKSKKHLYSKIIYFLMFHFRATSRVFVAYIRKQSEQCNFRYPISCIYGVKSKSYISSGNTLKLKKTELLIFIARIVQFFFVYSGRDLESHSEY